MLVVVAGVVVVVVVVVVAGGGRFGLMSDDSMINAFAGHNHKKEKKHKPPAS